jgi:hypothetical protein
MKNAGESGTPRSLRWSITAAAALAVLTAFGIWFVTQRVQQLSAKLGIEPAEKLRCEPEQGFSASYRLRVETELKLNATALIGDPRTRGRMLGSKAGFGARLRVRAVEASGADTARAQAGTMLAMQLDEIEPNTDATPVSNELSAELSRPFFAVLGKDCRIAQTGFAPDLSPEAINWLQGLGNGLSMVVEHEPSQSVWITQEHDSVGHYAARYTRSGSATPRGFVKQRTAYLRVHAQTGTRFKEPLLVRILSSSTSGELDEQHAWLSRVESRDHHQITRANAMLVADLQTSLSLERSTDAAPLELSLLSDLRWRNDRQPPLEAAPRRPDPPAYMATLTLDDALAQYAALLRSGQQGAFAQAADFLALFLRAQPAYAFEIMARLQRGQVPADLESTLFLALELAGTTEAHDALVQGLSDQHAARNRARAAAALPDVPNPSEGTLAALATTAREALAETKDETRLVRNSATYALGALELRTRSKNPELAKHALGEIRGQLEKVQSPNELAAALDAVANSGNSAFIADLKPHLDAKDALVRAHAIEAMGHMDPEANKSVFRGLIDAEQDPRIRGTIAQTYADQARRADSLAPSEVVRGALDVLVREPDPRVRGLLIDLVGPSCASDPRTMQALAEQFKRENDPLLLRQIGRYVPADKLGS